MEQKTTKKISLREVWRCNTRMLSVWRREEPRLFSVIILETLVSTLAPYVSIYFSARLIDEIAGSRDPHTLWTLATAVLASTAFLQLLAAALRRLKTVLTATGIYAESRLYMDKYLTMDFDCMDDNHTRELYASIIQNRDWSL